MLPMAGDSRVCMNDLFQCRDWDVVPRPWIADGPWPRATILPGIRPRSSTMIQRARAPQRFKDMEPALQHECPLQSARRRGRHHRTETVRFEAARQSKRSTPRLFLHLPRAANEAFNAKRGRAGTRSCIIPRPKE